MSKRDTEIQLKNAVSHLTPDIRDQVVEKCRRADGTDAPVFIRNYRNRRKERVYGLIAIAAMLLLVLSIAIDVGGNIKKSTAVTIVDIDVNPSIELKINSDDRIVSVRAINDDAKIILDGMDLNGTQTKVAVNAIIGSMVEHGYLQGNTDSILVSVNNRDAQVSEQIQNTITTDIDQLMKGYSRDVSVIGQSITEDSELINISNSYDISEGKAALIRKIIEYNDIYTFDELAHLTISELNEIICNMEMLNDKTGADDNQEGDFEEPEESDITVSDNSAADQTEDETVSENSADSDETEITVSDNSVSENDISDDDTVSANAVSDNSVSDNKAPTVSDNQIESNEETSPEGIVL